jgi:hypothetical protein
LVDLLTPFTYTMQSIRNLHEMQKGLRRWFCDDQRHYDPLKHDADATKEEMQQIDALVLHADHREEWWLPMYLALAMGVLTPGLGSICDCCLADARIGDGRFTAWAVHMTVFVIAAIKVARVTKASWNEAMCMQEARSAVVQVFPRRKPSLRGSPGLLMSFKPHWSFCSLHQNQ